ncbi:hypothetical protein [Aquimarina latercula]|uniref:hypothetical protein n=1 Tax=Aquimarina latercula TaxID=987 RepID=UPI0012DD44FA|nr:hypothetical protein [Aquimarina latercula]
MKNFFRTKKLISIFCLMLIIISCTKEEDTTTNPDNNVVLLEGNEISQKTIDDIVAEMKSIGDSQGKTIEFELKHLTKPDYHKYFKIQELTQKIMIFNNADKPESFLAKSGDNYTVTCTYGDGSTETTECGASVRCAGAATWACIDNGGCATVCNARISYTPAWNKITAEKTSKEKSIDEVLKQVEQNTIAKKSKSKAIAVTINFDGDKFWLKQLQELDEKSIQLSDGVTGDDPQLAGGWQVDCYNGDGQLQWSGTYDSRNDAGAAVILCTDGGGCANVCSVQAIYFPGDDPTL